MRQVVRILIIEDQAALAADAQREIEEAFEDSDEIEAQVLVVTDFDEGFQKVRDGESDVVVLDVRRDATASTPEDDTAGHAGYLDIKKARFAPIVFWTALPEKVSHEEMPPLVTVVTKEDTEKLPAAIAAAVASRALVTINEIEQHVASVLTEHMWNELAPNWTEYVVDGESADIAQVLLSRLARILDDRREEASASHPSHRYVYPPASARRAPGDILRASDQGWWVTLTPACDFAQDKVKFALLARADLLESNARYQKWVEAKSKGAWNELERNVLKATQGRYYYLPGFRDIPELVLDLENVRAVAVDELGAMEPVASLASPFSEALLVQHSQFRGRIGVPDLDVSLVQARLLSSSTTD
ncbi:hypothetical protein ACFQE5_13895 [Pseudonocardia hispaniensis]|uniref:Response regulator receiver domain-containing protein n=1 Tax=Pseudonocardia hispaniensis TaxID=904933 RepID=A0ABW1J481_9PSEU